MLPPKTLIATLKSRDAPALARVSEAPVWFPNTPVWVLTDGGTASAAELFAAALQETGRAQVIGKPTYGKTRIQRVVDLPGGGALLLTRQTYLTPKGRDLTGAGIKPDLVADCKTTDDALLCLDSALRSSYSPPPPPPR
jgi:carboxyl-terminal processing protease